MAFFNYPKPCDMKSQNLRFFAVFLGFTRQTCTIQVFPPLDN
jgi:hypothetical protein